MLYLLALLLVVLTIAISTGFGNVIYALIDPASMLVIIALPIVLILLAGQFNDFKRAFRIQVIKENIYTLKELKLAELAVSSFMKFLWTSAAFGTVLGIVMILALISDRIEFMKSLSVSSLMVFYATLIQLVISSMSSKIKRLIIELEGGDE